MEKHQHTHTLCDFCTQTERSAEVNGRREKEEENESGGKKGKV